VAGGADLPAAPTGAHLGHLALHASWQARLLLALCGVHSLPEAGHKAAQARREPGKSAPPRWQRRAAPEAGGACAQRCRQRCAPQRSTHTACCTRPTRGPLTRRAPATSTPACRPAAAAATTARALPQRMHAAHARGVHSHTKACGAVAVHRARTRAREPQDLCQRVRQPQAMQLACCACAHTSVCAEVPCACIR